MNLSADNEKEHRATLLLTRMNWSTWNAKVKDYILALDHDDAADMWQAYEWKRTADNVADPDPADHDYQTCTNAAERKLRVQHNKAYKFIRSALTNEIFDTTLQLPTSVPKLLRHLHRQVVSDGTVSDRDRLRTEYQELTLEGSSDMQTYITAFKNMVHTLRDLKLGLVAEDGDVLHQFNKGLPSSWGNHKSIVSGLQLNFAAASAYYLKQAKDDATLPGSLKKRTKNSDGTVHYGQGCTVSRGSPPCRQVYPSPGGRDPPLV